MMSSSRRESGVTGNALRVSQELTLDIPLETDRARYSEKGVSAPDRVGSMLAFIASFKVDDRYDAT
jgi:hypothetical protein